LPSHGPRQQAFGCQDASGLICHRQFQSCQCDDAFSTITFPVTCGTFAYSTDATVLPAQCKSTQGQLRTNAPPYQLELSQHLWFLQCAHHQVSPVQPLARSQVVLIRDQRDVYSGSHRGPGREPMKCNWFAPAHRQPMETEESFEAGRSDRLICTPDAVRMQVLAHSHVQHNKNHGSMLWMLHQCHPCSVQECSQHSVLQSSQHGAANHPTAINVSTMLRVEHTMLQTLQAKESTVQRQSTFLEPQSNRVCRVRKDPATSFPMPFSRSSALKQLWMQPSAPCCSHPPMLHSL
jgi:hypothetical protein